MPKSQISNILDISFGFTVLFHLKSKFGYLSLFYSDKTCLFYQECHFIVLSRRQAPTTFRLGLAVIFTTWNMSPCIRRRRRRRLHKWVSIFKVKVVQGQMHLIWKNKGWQQLQFGNETTKTNGLIEEGIWCKM